MYGRTCRGYLHSRGGGLFSEHIRTGPCTAGMNGYGQGKMHTRQWQARPLLMVVLLAGFEESRTLACKMVRLYKLASESLSQQDHYDFGMRAVKSVLVMAGSLRRSEPQLAEDVTLIRAMRDSNLPKFLSPDIELFQNIISDLFPGVDVPYQVTCCWAPLCCMLCEGRQTLSGMPGDDCGGQVTALMSSLS